MGGELTTPEVAQHLGRSLAWVKRHSRELGGRLIGGAYQFPAIAIERRRTITERITVGGGMRPDRAREAGALAAKVFGLLRATIPLDEIVERLGAEGADPDAVLRLHDQWMKCRARTAAWLARETGSPSAAKDGPIAGPVFDHRPSIDSTCCAGHRAAREHETRSR